MKMGLMLCWVLLLLFGSVYQVRSGATHGVFEKNPELEWVTVEKELKEETPEVRSHRHSSSGAKSSTPESMELPQYLIVSPSKHHKEAFKPQRHARPLPHWAVNMLRGRPPNVLTPKLVRDPRKLVEILCHIDRIYVKIKKGVFKTLDAYKYLKLGTCPVNQGTKSHYYLLYLLTADCGFQNESTSDYLYISNVLRYEPPGPVLREMPFSVPLQCIYPRSFYSYETGFYPAIQERTVLKVLGQKSTFSLTPQDDAGNDITGKAYILGEPMYFEAKEAVSGGSGNLRIYINKCVMTASRDPNSNPKYTVIDNHGCMIDGKMSDQSKFIHGALLTAQKFSVGASVFKEKRSPSCSSQKLYMHCEITIGRPTSTPSSKACNYDPATGRWKELYGDHSVCTCCESTCPSAKLEGSQTIISSPPWNVKQSGEDESEEEDTDTFTGRTSPDKDSGLLGGSTITKTNVFF